MTTWLRRLFLSLAAVSGASGGLYALLRYALEPSDEFSAYNHPAQPFALALHVASSVALTFVLGIVFHEHVLPRLASERRARRTGLALSASAAAMIASGAFLPSASEAWVREAWLWTHLISGTGFALLVPVHLVLARRAARWSSQLPREATSVGPADRKRRRASRPRLRA